MTRIVFLDADTIGPSVPLTRPDAPHEWVVYGDTSDDQVVEHLAGATVAILNKVALRGRHLAQLPDLKFVAIAATGYDNVDVDVCRERGIGVSNVRGYAATTVSEHTLALILALRRSLMGFSRDVVAGKWQEARQFSFFTHPIRDLAGSRIGVVGSGSIGQAVARLARGVGMDPVFADRDGAHKGEPGYAPFEAVLETADILSLHLPLTPATRNLIAMPEFRRMTRQPLIINTARGGLVNEADVVAALDEGLISGIGFDVLSTEPPAPDNPVLAVLDRPDVIVTPHVAWASDDAMRTLWGQVVENIEAFLAGAPVHLVT